MTLGNGCGTRPTYRLVQGVRSPGRARSCGDGRAVRRRDHRSRVARSAGVLPVWQPHYRHGGDRHQAGIALTAPLLSKSPSRPLSTLSYRFYRIELIAPDGCTQGLTATAFAWRAIFWLTLVFI